MNQSTIHHLLPWVLPLLGLAGCGQAHSASHTPPTPVVRVVQPIQRQVVDYQYFTGRSEAVESVEVRARVTGYLVEIHFKAGQDVRTGDLLFKIDPRPYQAVVDQANGQVALTEAQLKLAIADYARALEIAKTPGAISQQDVDKYAAAKSEAEAAVQAAKAAAESADLNLQFTDVVSPIDGVVGRNLISIGNLVSQDVTLLTTIVSQDPIYAYFDVDERTLLEVQTLIREGKIEGVRQGGKVPVQIGLANEGADYPHNGLVDFVNNRIDPTTGTLQLRAVLDNPAVGNGPRQFAPGMFLRVRLPIGPPHDALLVPQSALNTDQNRKYVLVVNEQNVVEYRSVTAGAIQPDGLQEVQPVQQVREGDVLRLAGPDEQGQPSLTTSDRVIVSGTQRVRPGLKVEAKPLDAAQGGGS